MAATKKVGELVKEARTKAKLTQEQLAQQVDGVSASDIGKCERGEKDLSQAALKQIAKATGVTQKSLLEAPKNVADTGKTSSSSAKTSSSGKTSSATPRPRRRPRPAKRPLRPPKKRLRPARRPRPRKRPPRPAMAKS